MSVDTLIELQAGGAYKVDRIEKRAEPNGTQSPRENYRSLDARRSRDRASGREAAGVL